MLSEQHLMRRFVLTGVAGGVLAGVVFALVEMIFSAVIGYSTLTLFRAVGSIILGPQALSNEYPLGTSLGVGIVLHLLLSAIYGAIFAWILWITGQAGKLSSLTMSMGALYALALWAINFLVIAPMLFEHMVIDTTFWLSYTIAHFFYGLVLGGYMWRTSQRESPEPRVR